jgi:hypothetical protein
MYLQNGHEYRCASKTDMNIYVDFLPIFMLFSESVTIFSESFITLPTFITFIHHITHIHHIHHIPF